MKKFIEENLMIHSLYLGTRTAFTIAEKSVLNNSNLVQDLLFEMNVIYTNSVTFLRKCAPVLLSTINLR